MQIRLATFLAIIGEAGYEKYETFTFSNDDDGKDLTKVIEKFDQECKKISNVLNERYHFFKRRQYEAETIDQYVTQLKILAKTCEFPNTQESIRD